MKTIRILEIVFSPEIKGKEINAFRGAIAKKVGYDSILFHNHTKDGFRYRYPFIQYKRIKKKASIICIEQGVDDIYKLFNKPDWTLNLNGNKIELKIEHLRVNKFNLNAWDKYFEYRIFNWLALNPKNFKIYKSADSLTEKIQLLEKVLKANILSFAKSINWYLDKDIDVKITEIINEKSAKYKNLWHFATDIAFKTNVFLPQHIGLGKAASHGFGVVYIKK